MRRFPGGISVLMLGLTLVGCAQSGPPHTLDGPGAKAPVRVEPWAYGDRLGHKVHSAHYVLLTTIDDGDVVDSLSQVMEGAFTQYRHIAPDAPMTNKPMECFLFQYRNEWASFTKTNTGTDAPIYLQINRGGYTFGDKYVAFFIGDIQTYSVAAHEGWHQYVARHFKHRPPPFLEEGLACLFEQVRWEGNLPRWDLASNSNRIHGLYNAQQSRTLIPLRKLIAMHAGQVVDQSTFQVETFYAQNWAFARFMWDGEDGRYRPALQKLLADAAAGKLYNDGVARDPASTDWDPSSAAPILERYLAMPMPAIERTYRDYIRKITAGMGPRVEWRRELAPVSRDSRCMNRRTYYFSGHVQGVGFRYTARHAANGRQVTGYVRNLDDGRVELVMEGSDAEMDGVLEGIQAELGRNISRTTCDTTLATGEFSSFGIRH